MNFSSFSRLFSKKWLRGDSAKNRHSKKRKLSRWERFVRLNVEVLEDRTLMSVNPLPIVSGQTDIVSLIRTGDTGFSAGNHNTPSIAVDPNNSDNMVAVFYTQSTNQFTTSHATSNTDVIQLAYSNNAGLSWTGLNMPEKLPQPDKNPTADFEQANDPTVAWDRQEHFYITYVEHQIDESAGAVRLVEFNFASVATTVIGTSVTVSPPTQVDLDPVAFGVNAKTLYEWFAADPAEADAAYNPMLAIDNNLRSFTDPESGITQDDSLVDPASNRGIIYVAWNTDNTAPTDNANKITNFNGNTIKLMASADGGITFTTQKYVNDGALLNPNSSAITSGLREHDATPRLVVSQGSADGRVQGGQLSIVWDDFGRNTIFADSVKNGGYGYVSAGTSGVINDAGVTTVNLYDQTTNFPPNTPVPPSGTGGSGTSQDIFSDSMNVANQTVNTSNVTVTVDLTHQNPGDLEIRLSGPGLTGPTKIMLASQGTLTGPGPYTFTTPGFNGVLPNGTWTLEVEDKVTGNVGTISSWELKIDGQASAPIATTFTDTVNITDPHFYKTNPATGTPYLDLSDLDVTVSLAHPEVDTISAVLTAPDGRTVTLFRVRNAAGTTGLAAGLSVGVVNPAPASGSGLRPTSVGTVFDQEAPRPISDGSANEPYTEHFKPEGNFTDAFGELATFYTGLQDPAGINGTWTLTITDTSNGPTGIPFSQRSVTGWSLNFTSKLTPGTDNAVTSRARDTSTPSGTQDPLPATGMFGAAGNTAVFSFPLQPISSPELGIGPTISLASDNTLGSFSPYQGRLYVAYTSPAGAVTNANTDIRLIASDDGGVTWTALASNDGSFANSTTVRVNDDSVTDGFSEGNRPQFAPSLAVDNSTGTLVASYYDARYDPSQARVVTTVASSIDGGSTFGPQIFVNNSANIVDAITLQQTAPEPIPDNQSSGNAGRDTDFWFGDHEGLAVAQGKIIPIWTGNQNGATGLNIYSATATLPAGPRVIASTMGPVTASKASTDNGTIFDFNNTFTADGIQEVTGFTVTFDRPVDALSFSPADVNVLYRSASTAGNVPGTPVTVAAVVPLDFNTQFGPEGAGGPTADGRPTLATSFFVRFLVPQAGIGTYSYTIGPGIRDRIRQTVSTNRFHARPDQLNLPIPPSGTGGSGVPSADVTTSNLVIDNYPRDEVITDIDVNLSLLHNNDGDLQIRLVGPNGATVILSDQEGSGGVNFTNTTFDDQAAQTLVSTNVAPPFTGTFITDDEAFLSGTGLNDAFAGISANGTWRLEVEDLQSANTGILLDWSLIIRTKPRDPVTAKSTNQTITLTRPAGMNEVITHVGVNVDYLNPNDGNVVMTLIPPKDNVTNITPAPIILVQNRGGTNDDFINTTFDDGATTSIAAGTAPYTGYFIPEAALDSLKGFHLDGTGTWTLQITDSGNAGTFYNWSLILNTSTAINPITYSSGTVDVPVPTSGTGGTGTLNGQGTLQDIARSSINVAGVPTGEVIDHLSVNVNLDHTSDSDLILTLIDPNGDRVLLAENEGGNGQNFTNTTFDDNATTPISAGTAPFTGSFQPEAPLSFFNGINPNGAWTLEVLDNVTGNVGTLHNWSLTIDTTTSNILGNSMDQNANGATGWEASDIYAVPKPTGNPVLTTNSEVQTVTVSGSSGTYTLTFNGQTTTELAFNASAGQIQSALNALSSIGGVGGSVAVSKLLNVYTVTFGSALGLRDVPQMIAAMGSIPGASVIVATSLQGGSFFSPPFDTDTLPIIVPGPHLVTSRIYQAPPTPVNLSIPHGGTLAAPMTIVGVATDRTITDINVNVSIQTAHASDLQLKLLAPDGVTEVVLAQNDGGSGANFTNTTFDDQAAVSITAGAAPFNGSFRPRELLSVLNDLDPNGLWTLEVTATTATMDSLLVNWSLTIDTSPLGTTAQFSSSPAKVVPPTGTGGTGFPAQDITTDNINVTGFPAGEIVTDLNVTVALNHTNDSDLVISLINGATRVVLAQNDGGSGANFTNATFDDQAGVKVSAGVAPFTGSFRPRTPLAAFNGFDPNGTWTLEINDTKGNNVGVLSNWTLTVSTGSRGDPITYYPQAIPPLRTTTTNTYSSTANKLVPPAGTGGSGNPALDTTQDQITISGVSSGDVVSQVQVKVNLTHQLDSDLTLTLVSPNNLQRVVLSQRRGGTSSNFTNVIFDDFAATPISSVTGPGPITGSFQPDDLLNVLNGVNPNGTWTLEVTDNQTGNTGVLLDWSLIITTVPTIAESALTINTGDPNDQVENIKVHVDINHEFDGVLSLELIAPDGTAVSLSQSRGGSGHNYTGTVFDDASHTPIGLATAPFTGSFKPEVPLSTFQGKNVNGTWTLKVEDTFPGFSTGLLLDWSLEVQTAKVAIDGKMDHIDVVFDRDMDPTSFDATDIVRIARPAVNGVGLVSGPFTVTTDPNANPLFPDPDPSHPRTFRITFPSQDVSGTYTIVLGPNIKSKSGDLMDTNLNAGLYSLRDVNALGVTATVPDVRSSGNVNLPLPPRKDSVSTITIPASQNFVISSLTLKLDLQYPSVPDLEIRLIAPDGTTVQLFTGFGPTNGHDLRNTVFDDNATVPIQNGVPPYTNTFNPQTPLSVLKNKAAAGTYQLQIINHSTSTSGTLFSWSLTFQKAQTATGLGEPIIDQATADFRIFSLGANDRPLSSSNWTAVGPASNNTLQGDGTVQLNGNAGRVTAIAVDPSDPSGNTVYVGGASGGVWKTTNFLTTDAGGPTYVPLTDFGPTDALNIESIAVFGRNNDPKQSIIFAATGEGDSSIPTFGPTAAGVGFLRSMDAGATWDLLDSTTNVDASGNPLPFNSPLRDHMFVGSTSFKIIVDPTHAFTGPNDVIVYAAMGSSASGPGSTAGGIWRSKDSGKHWTLTGGKSETATDVALVPFSKTATSGEAQMLYGAYMGDGVFSTPNQGDRWDIMTGLIGDPLIRTSPSVTPASATIQVTAPPATPNGVKGRITLATPSLTGNNLHDLLYEGWLYVAVATPAGSNIDGDHPLGSNLDGLYVTKDFGQNWTRIGIPNFMARIGVPANANFGGALLTSVNLATNDPLQPTLDVFNEDIVNTLATSGGQGNYDNSLVVDPDNPDIVYLGGSGSVNLGVPIRSQLLRLDVTQLFDPKAVNSWADSENDGGQLSANTVGAVNRSNPAQPNTMNGKVGLIDPPGTLPLPPGGKIQQYVNVLNDPSNPFLTNATVHAANIDSFTNSGENVHWNFIEDVLKPDPFDPNVAQMPTINVHRLVTIRDPLTGKTRLIVGDDNGVFSAVLSSDGTLTPGIGTAVTASGTRNGNLQIAQFAQGAVQPSILADNIAQAMFYGQAADNNGSPRSTSDILTNGLLSWTGPLGDGQGIATDQTGSGTVAQFNWPGFGAISSTDFLEVTPPGGTAVGRTFGLFQEQPPQNSSYPDPEWPVRGGSNIVINPLSGNQMIVSSGGNGALFFNGPYPGGPGASTDNFGTIFRTRNQGFRWDVIATPADITEPGDLPTGLYAQALAYGAVDPNGPNHGANLDDFIYAGLIDGRVWVTFSGGAGAVGNQWRDISAGLDLSPVEAIVANPTRGSHEVYAVTQRGVYHMLDSVNSPTWTNVTGDIFTSLNNAFGNPTLAGLLLPNLTSLAVDWRFSTPVLYVGSENGVFRSKNGGVNWTQYPNVINDGAKQDGGMLPNVRITDLDLVLGNIDPSNGKPNESTGPNMLVASTFGRGAFAIRLDTNIPNDFVSGPRVIAIGPAVPPISGNFTSITVTFSTPVDAATFVPSAFTITGPGGPITPTTITHDVSFTTYQIQFAPQTNQGKYTLTIQPTVADPAGHRLNQNNNGVNGEASDVFTTNLFVSSNNDDALFVAGLFHDGYNRASDTATFNGLFALVDTARNNLLFGTANSFLNTDDYRTTLVKSWYLRYQGRDFSLNQVPQADVNYWAGQLLVKGMTDEKVIAQLVAGVGIADNAAWVANAYSTILPNHGPDPSGQAFWVGQLQMGLTRNAVAKVLLGTTEYRSDLIKSYYKTYLHRDFNVIDPLTSLPQVSQAEIDSWVGQLNKLTDEKVVLSFVSSTEYFQKAGNTNALWIRALYRDLLGRGANYDAAVSDPGGFAYNLNNLLDGYSAQRKSAATSIINSAEYRSDLVKSFYLKYQNRSFDLGQVPQTDIDYWTGQLAKGIHDEAVIATMIGADTTTDDVTWLNNTYQTILGHAPDASGQTYWLNQLATNKQKKVATVLARGGVAAGLLNSDEYRSNLVKSYYLQFLGLEVGQQFLDNSGPLLQSDVDQNSFWVTQLRKGMTDEQVIINFLSIGKEGRQYFLRQHTYP